MTDIATATEQSTTAQMLDRLRPWLAARLSGGEDVTLVDAVEPKQGFSSRTILFKAVWHDAGGAHARDLVARIGRDTGGAAAAPMLGDIFHQYRVMRAIAAASDVAVPRIDFAEEDSGLLGAPFFLMDRVDGRVPGDFPSYHAEGWLVDELTPAERARTWWNGVEEMERLHRISWRAFPFLADGIEQAPTAGFFLERFLAPWFAWAENGRSYPLIEEALRFLLANQPPASQSGLCWNDARMGNTMFARDRSVASLFDFEVATLGPPELDLGHWLYLDEIFSINFGIPRLEGIPSREEAIRGFERIYGWPMPYFSYYEAVAALKILILSIRDYSNGKTMNAPEALPNFLVDRLKQYLAEYAATLA